MSISVNLHTKTAKRFEVGAKISNLSSGSEAYPVIKIEATPEGTYDYQEITMFPSFEQAKQLHKELSKLMKDMAALEKRTKAEIKA
jgi:hypothetical protein